MENHRTILITAYAVNPYKGSEDGTGWNIPVKLSKSNKVIVITRKNNQPEIDRYCNENPENINLDNISFHYYDLPQWLMSLKKKLGERGYVLYFYLWQLFMPLFIKRNKFQYDILHALNFHSDSQPQFLWTLNKPVFWGPIGHHSPVPKAFILKPYGFKKYLKDRVYNLVKILFRKLDPFYYLSKWTAKKIFVINSSINDSVKAHDKKVEILPAVASNPIQSDKKIIAKNFNVLSVGRFTFMKGFDTVIKSYSQFYHSLDPEQQKFVKLTLVGKGEEENYLRKLIKNERIEEVVEIINWVKFSDMQSIYLKSSVFLFGSHEGAGMVVPEALSYGVPIICFNNEGPGELCSEENAIKIEVRSYDQALNDFSSALNFLFNKPNELNKMSSNAREYAKSKFSWANKAHQINKAYDSVNQIIVTPIKTA